MNQLAQNEYDDKVQDIARAARDYQKQYPDMKWGECIKIAEKHIEEDSRNQKGGR